MTTYKYADAAKTIVMVIDDDGVSRTSGIAADVVPEGAPIADPDPAVLQAMSCTPRQFRQALNAISLRTAVESAIAAADQNTKDWYQYAQYFEITNPFLVSMATTLGKTQSDINALFNLAATL